MKVGSVSILYAEWTHLEHAVLDFHRLSKWARVMLFDKQEQFFLADVREYLRHAIAVTPELVGEVSVAAGIRSTATNSSAHTSRMRNLIAAEAWTDVALALIEMELPRWRLVRLVMDGDDWCCALSKHRQLPDWLDDAVEARHNVLPLVILDAFVQARTADLASAWGRHQSVPGYRLQQSNNFDALCCDNFR